MSRFRAARSRGSNAFFGYFVMLVKGREIRRVLVGFSVRSHCRESLQKRREIIVLHQEEPGDHQRQCDEDSVAFG